MSDAKRKSPLSSASRAAARAPKLRRAPFAGPLAATGQFGLDADLLTVDETSAMHDAIALLNRERVSTVPVRRVAGSLEEQLAAAAAPRNAPASFVGFLDMIDVAAFVAEQRALQRRAAAAADVPHVTQPALSEASFEARVSVYVNESQRDPFTTLDVDAPLRDAVDELCDKHRVAVTRDKSVVGVLAQSDLVALFAERQADLAIAATPLVDLGLDHDQRKPLVSVTAATSVSDALDKLLDEKVSGVPVLNGDGRVQGEFSCGDVCRIFTRPSKLAELDQPLSAVVGYEEHEDERRSAVVCALDNTLGELLTRVAAAKAHRAFVVDRKTQRPLSVIALADILCIIRDHLKATSGEQDKQDQEEAAQRD